MANPKVPLQNVQTGDRVANDAQKLARAAAEAINAFPLLGAKLLDTEPGAVVAHSGLTFATGVPRAIAHGLNRKFTGWIEVYLADVASATFVGLFASAPLPGTSSLAHVNVTPLNTGKCAILVW